MSHRQEVMPTLLFKCIMISSSNRRFLSSMSSENTKFERVRGGEKSNERERERERNGERWRERGMENIGEGGSGGGGREKMRMLRMRMMESKVRMRPHVKWSSLVIHPFTLSSLSPSFALHPHLFSFFLSISFFLEEERNLSLSDLFSRIRL